MMSQTSKKVKAEVQGLASLRPGTLVQCHFYDMPIDRNNSQSIQSNNEGT